MVSIFAQVLTWMIIIRAILSWFGRLPYHPLLKFLFDVTDIILRPFQRLMPPASGLDFSPIFALVAIWLAEKLLITVLLYLPL